MPVTTTVPALRMAENAWAHVLGLEHADGDDGRVGALAVGDRAGELGRLVHRGEGVGGAERQGRLPLELDRVDGDDVGGADVRRALHGVDADAADAHDDDGLAGPGLGGVDRPSPTRCRRRSRRRQAFSSGRSLSTFTHDATSTTVSSQNVEMPAPWPIGWPSMLIRKLPSDRHPVSTLAPRSHRFCMPDAHQRQRPQPGRNDSTTWSPTSQPGVFGPTLDDDAGALVAAGHRQDAGRQVAGGHVVVGVAEPRGHHLQLDLALARLLHVDVEDLPLARHLSDHRTACLHDCPPLRR